MLSYAARPQWTQPSGAAHPVITVEVAPQDGVFTLNPTWYDVTADVEDIDMTLSGRQAELEDMQTASGSAVFRDKTRKFDPSYGGTVLSSLHPLMQFRVTASYNSLTWYVFRGLLTRLRIDWESGGNVSQSLAKFQISDWIPVLANYPYGGTHASAEGPATRLGAILTNVGQSASLRTGFSDTGLFQVQAKTYVQGEDKAWEAIKETYLTGAADIPLRFDGQGRAHYGPGVVTPYIFGDSASSGTEIPYAPGGGADQTVDSIATHVSVSRLGGNTQSKREAGSSYEDLSSVRAYTRDTLLTSDADALTMATTLFNAKKIAQMRLDSITVYPYLLPDRCWTPILDLEQEDIVLFRRRPPGGGVIQLQKKIAQIKHKFSPVLARWETTYRLSSTIQ